MVRKLPSLANFEQRVEHLRQIEGRAAYDLEHLGARGLALQRLVQLASEPRYFCFLAGNG
jgi:hypothetical protein